MSDYKIITDSNCDFTPALIEELDIQVIPMEFVMGEKVYRNYPDERDMSAKEFYSRIRSGESSTTNQINTATFIDVFTPILSAGHDLFYMAFSSGLSGTYNSACMAVEELRTRFPERTIIVVDTLAASMGEGLLVYYAVQQKRAGLSMQELEQWVIGNRNHLAHWFTVDDLNHLKRGGRVSSTAAFVGTMLGIKPVLHVDNEGHLIPVEKVRGRRQSLDALVKHMGKTAQLENAKTVFLSHGDAQQDAEYVAAQIREKFPGTKIYINMIGPVIGAHSGPGTIALFFMADNKD